MSPDTQSAIARVRQAFLENLGRANANAASANAVLVGGVVDTYRQFSIPPEDRDEYRASCLTALNGELSAHHGDRAKAIASLVLDEIGRS